MNDQAPRLRGEVQIAALSSVRPNSWNPNAVPEHIMDSIRHGFRSDGWLVSQALLIWGSDETGTRHNVIIDGEHRHRAGLDVGLVEGPMVFLEGLAEAEAKALTVKLNQKRGDWDEDKLAALLLEIALDPDVSSEAHALDLGFDSSELDRLVASAAETLELTTEEEKQAEDAAIRLDDKEPIVQAGEVWMLGRHVVICGDSFKPENVAKVIAGKPVDLVLTDPPYAIYGSSTGIGADIADDKMVRPFFEQLFRTVRRSLKEFGHCYVHCDWRSWAAVWDGAQRARMTPKNMIVWDKGGGLGASYGNAHELVGFFANLPPPTAMKSSTRRGQRTVLAMNIMRHNRVTGEEHQHNAAKPVKLLEDLIKNSTDDGERVLDLFLGSGSTLLACEKTGRTCMGLEIEPRHCDVTITRWEKLTGQKAMCVLDRADPAEVLEALAP